MKKIIFLKGLPGSGKSTWAKDLISKNPNRYKRINKDDLRSMLDNGQWGKKNEKFVIEIRNLIAGLALGGGYDVIIDDTNLHPKHEQYFKEVAQVMGASFEIKDFTDVPLKTCIENDLKRTNSVGKDVIMQMYNQFLKPAPKVVLYDPDPKMIDVVICDIDGTLALFGDANPYDRDFTKDTPNVNVVVLLKSYVRANRTIFVSGRKESARMQTLEWLGKTFPELSMPLLFMRKDDDNRKDVLVKREIYETYIKGNYNISFVLDDRDQVVEMWREEGLTCLQVAPGDF